MRTTVLITFTLLLSISCQNTGQKKQHHSYEINGKLRNVPDSTIVMIATKNTEIDSTIVIGEKFSFTGTIEVPTKVYLVVKNSQDYVQFWLENTKIDIMAEKGKFKESQITGSQTQEEDVILSNRIKLAQKEMESLSTMLKSAKEITTRDSIYKLMETKGIEVYRNFIKDYPSSLVSSFTISDVKSRLGYEKTKEFYNMLSSENKESVFGQEIKRFITLHRNVSVGQPYIDFQMTDVNGSPQKLSDFENKVILLEFWASWCGPCRQENPNLVEIYKTYHSEGFDIFAVSLDDNGNKWKEAIEHDKLPWIQVSTLKGRDNEAALIYGINGIPDNFLINQKGIIVGRNLRGEKLKEELDQIFKHKASL